MVTVKKDNREVVAVFDGSFDGFLCIVYAFYYEKITPIIIQSEDQVQLILGGEEHRINTCSTQATRVFKGIRDKISEDAATRVYYAFLSGEDNKYMEIFRYIQLGFVLGHMIDSHLQEDCVRRVHKLAGHVGREAHLLFGFCRFAETSNKVSPSQSEEEDFKLLAYASGVLYCAVTPKNDVLPLLANHFSERFMNQSWVIHDKRRHQAAIYDGKTYVISHVPHNVDVSYAENELETQELWRTFFKALAIEARKNPKVQRQLLPLYFRKNMTEFTTPNKL